MKRYILSALTVLLSSAAIAPVAQAFEPEISLQERRIEVLDSRSKNIVQKLRVEHLNTQTKAIDNIQSARLDLWDSRDKRQVSTPAEISEDATFHDLVRFNRRARNKG